MSQQAVSPAAAPQARRRRALARPVGPLVGSLTAAVVALVPPWDAFVPAWPLVGPSAAAVVFVALWIVVDLWVEHAGASPWHDLAETVDDGVGTRAVSWLLVVLASVLAVASVTRPSVAVFALMLLVTGVLCARAAVPAREVTEAEIEPGGDLPPDDPAQYRRVDLSWSLQDVDPNLHGTVGCWVSLERLQRTRAENPGTRTVEGAPDVPDLVSYVEGGRCPEVDAVVDGLARQARDLGLDRVTEVRMVLDLVQRIPYRTDEESTGQEDYWRYPLEMLADGQGDCEDASILLAALLSGLGHRVCFFNLPNHAAVGIAGLPRDLGIPVVFDGVDYQYAETTETGFEIGEWPDGHGPADAKVVGVVLPLHGHREDPVLRPDEAGAWGRGTRVLVAGGAVAAVVVAVVGLVA